MKIKTKYQLPLIIMIAYLIFTLALYQFGPIAWVTYRPVYFWTLQILYIFMISCGWQVGINRTFTDKKVWTAEEDRKVVKVLNLLLFFNLIYEIVNIFRIFTLPSFDVLELISRIKYGFSDMGGSYNLLQSSIGVVDGSDVVGGTAFSVFNYLWETVSFAIVLLSTFYFKKISLKSKVVLLGTYAIILVSYIATGTNIGVFRLVLAWGVFLLVKIVRGLRTSERMKWLRRKKWLVIFGVFGVLSCLILFNSIMISRGGIVYWNTDQYNIGGMVIDRDNLLLKILPNSLCMLLISATAYLTQGYYGMSLSLTVDWNPTFGVGHSMAIEKLLREYVTDLPYRNLYQHRIEMYDWDEMERWHSAYTWFANDFSFIGTAAIMFIYGVLFAMAYKDALRSNNPFAYVMVYFFTLMAFFLPCNNQLFQSTKTMFSFYTVLIVWLVLRGKRKKVLRSI